MSQPPSLSSDSDLALALTLADAADAISLDRFRALDLVVETKPDLTPVSDADRAVEDALRTTLSEQRPDDAVLGEEFGITGEAARRWVIDPIDGTMNYVRGVPVWATLIALIDHASPAPESVAVGVVSAPALGMRWWAMRGQGAWRRDAARGPQRLSVSRVSALEDCSISYSSHEDPAWVSTGTRSGFDALLSQAWRTRAYGDFWSHLLVAEGSVDIAIEPELNLWDMAAVIPIVTEAGGTFTALDGSPALSGGNGLSTNGVVHDQVLALLDATGSP